MDLAMHTTNYSMSVSSAHVPITAQVNWRILEMAMRLESEALRPTLTQLASALRELHEEVSNMVNSLDTLMSEVDPVLQDALQLKADTQPLWEDEYALCGNPQCAGDCRMCQEGEEDYEIDDSEKYCRRRR
jgi:hypothetical protein